MKTLVLFFMMLFSAYSFSKTPTTTLDKGDIKCKDIAYQAEVDGYKSGSVCFYPSDSLLKAYERYRALNVNNDSGKYLLKDIHPMKDLKDLMDDGNIEINYSWLNKSELKVVMLFPGGITTILFKENVSGTEVTDIDDPD